MSVHVIWVVAVIFKPVMHKLCVEPAVNFANKTVANLKADLVSYVAVVGQYHKISRTNHHCAVC